MRSVDSSRRLATAIRARVSNIRVLIGVLAAVFVPLAVVGQLGGIAEGSVLGLSLVEVNFALITLLAALALHVLIGRCGLISIGSAGFYALGAAAGGFFGVQLALPFEVVLVAAATIGAVVGAIVGLPSLKLKGLYALLATLAFHFIAVYAFLEYESAEFDTTGILFPPARVLGWELSDDFAWYQFLIVVSIVAYFGAVNLSRGRQGRALLAVRDQELAARLSGVPVGVTKVKTYALTSSITTVAGVLYAYYLSTATVELFTFDLALQLIAIIVIGGLTTASGAVIGVLVWTVLPKAIETVVANAGSGGAEATWVGDHINELTNGVFGLLIVTIMVLRPEGVMGLVRSVAGQGGQARALAWRRSGRE